MKMSLWDIRPRRLWVGYFLSWLRAEFVGMTICRSFGHREPEAEDIAFQRELGKLYKHPPESDVWDVICPRCGGAIRRMER